MQLGFRLKTLTAVEIKIKRFSYLIGLEVTNCESGTCHKTKEVKGNLFRQQNMSSIVEFMNATIKRQ